MSRGHGLTDQSHAAATITTSSPTRKPKNDGEVVQNRARREQRRLPRSPIGRRPEGDACSGDGPLQPPGLPGTPTVQGQPQDRSRQDKPRPRKQGESPLAGVGPDIPLERVRPRRQPSGVADGRRRHRDERRGGCQDHGTAQAGPRQTPNAGRRDNGRPHDVQDVDLEQASGVREPPERVGLEAEQKRVEKNLPAATFDEPGRLSRRPAPAHLRSGAQRDGDTGHEQEGWSRHAAQDHQPAIRGAGLLVRQGPRVEGVRFDHHEHGEAPQPVQIPETALTRRRAHGFRQPGRCSSWRRV